MARKEITVTIENLAPQQGTFLTPFWVGFHNGNFDTYDRGRPASPGLESLAEDGSTTLISQEFLQSGDGTVDGRILGPEGDAAGPIDPGEVATATFTLDSDDLNSQFFSYASMILPSNDAFVANGNPEAIQIFDEEGNFIGADFIIAGKQVLDAGTEVNDEAENSTAFFGQSSPDTGIDQNGVVQLHPGFVTGGRILSEDGSSPLALTAFTNGDFTSPDYQVARITISTEDKPLPIADPVRITSNLDGSQEVTAGDSDAQGTSVLTLNDTGDSLEYSLTVSGLDFGANGLVAGGAQTPDDTSDDVTRLHIHNASRGENGGVVFSLFDTVAPELGNQLNIQGNQDEDLNVTLNENGSVTLAGIWEETDSANDDLSELVAEIRDTQESEDLDLYFNVHTEEFPGGAIRGQLVVGDENNNTPPAPDLVEVTVTVENLAPDNGTLLTPLWVGFHDGTFDTYDSGRPASAGLESLAEDGNTSLISREFISSGAGLVDGTITAPGGATPGPIDIGETTSLTFTVDRSLASSRFLNYAAMLLPSNDAFIANGNPEAFEIFDQNGNFLGADFVVRGNQVLDAGTEVNDEAEDSTAFFGQSTPNTGTDENGVVELHQGFQADGRILSEPRFANADFTADGYEVARITVTTNDLPQTPLGAAFQDNGQGEALLDFRSIGNQQVTANLLEVTSEAAFNNLVGFYIIEDTQGTVLDEFGNALSPGDEGYAEAAVARRAFELNRNTTEAQQFAGGELLAPFIIANGTAEEFLSQNPSNQGGDDPLAYFSFLGANPDGVEHIRLVDNNTFGFEDLFGGGDNDFDDLFFRAEFEVA
ncbi:CHRD domain-containing protein [Rivularia sp. PCC 7116]|uniref:spondin domain-containing protein n=1 Tax=Rivularia sp. PCC 7116 TaxID=373994 RepID=UPI00029F0FA7|nr:spondin domain-containing protein [Rivularia sp. PCC 7116]AFY58063.1 CHRD domain-containing protein [Rivularia sp. PCC 7116]